MATKKIIANLNKVEKFNDDNFDIWHRKVVFILENQEVVEALNNTICQPAHGSFVHKRHDF